MKRWLKSKWVKLTSDGRGRGDEETVVHEEIRRASDIHPLSIRLFLPFFGGPARLLCWGLIFLFISYVVDWHAEVGSVASHKNMYAYIHEFFRDLGIAFVVSVAISVAIEQIATERRDQEIRSKVHEVQQNALAAVFNTTMPAEWLNFVRTVLQDQKFYRSRMTVRYTVREPLEAEQSLCKRPFVFCTVEMSYRVRNTGYSSRAYDIKCYVELPWEEELKKFARLESILIDGVHISDDQYKKAFQGEDLSFTRKYLHSHLIPSQGFVDVKVRVNQVMYQNDTTTFSCIDPCDSLDVHLEAPVGYRTYAMLKHPLAQDNGEGDSPSLYGTIEGTSELTIVASEANLDGEPMTGTGPKNAAPLKRKENARYVYTSKPCFPQTTVELSWDKMV